MRSVAFDHHAGPIIAGRDDDLVPWSNNEYLAELLPNSEIHPLDAGHFAWEQASDEYGRLILDWVTGGFRRLGGAVRPETSDSGHDHRRASACIASRSAG